MSENKQFHLKIKWYNKEKTEGEFILKDGGQPIGVIESLEDARLIKDTLNELYNENKQIKHTIQEAYNHERTALGKSILKQLIEAIQ